MHWRSFLVFTTALAAVLFCGGNIGMAAVLPQSSATPDDVWELLTPQPDAVSGKEYSNDQDEDFLAAPAPEALPEPATVSLLALGTVALLWRRRRHMRSA